MSSKTWVTVECAVDRIFGSYEELQDYIKEQEEYLAKAKSDLSALAAATPKDIAPKDEEPLFFVQNELSTTLEWYEELLSELTILWRIDEETFEKRVNDM